MQSTASNLEFKLNVNLRLVKPDFMQSTAVNLEFKLLSCNRPNDFKHSLALFIRINEYDYFALFFLM